MGWKQTTFVGWVWDDNYNPMDPSFGRPGGGWGLPDPDYGIGSGLHPGHGLPGGGGHPSTGPIYGGGHPSTGPIYGGGHPSTGPIYGGGHPSHGLPGQKPPGRPILPPDPSYDVPIWLHPWLPGWWEILDPGFGHSPILGKILVDPGYGVSEGGKPDQGLPGGGGHPSQGLPGSGGRPDQGLPPGVPPPTTKPPVGTWPPQLPGGWLLVPVDPDYGIPTTPCPGGKPRPPLWAVIPPPPDLSKPVPPAEPAPAPTSTKK